MVERCLSPLSPLCKKARPPLGRNRQVYGFIPNRRVRRLIKTGFDWAPTIFSPKTARSEHKIEAGNG
jgi:hypothetical protein